MLEIPNRAWIAPKTAPKSIWTDELFEYVKKLWLEQGFSAGAIATDLGSRNIRVSRNAIIGKLHRGGLAGTHPRNSSGVGASPRPKRRPASTQAIVHRLVISERKAKREVLREVAEATPQFRCDGFVGVAFGELTSLGQCRWPQGGDDPNKVHEMRFCGQTVFEGTSYCAGHFYRSLNREARSHRRGSYNWTRA